MVKEKIDLYEIAKTSPAIKMQSKQKGKFAYPANWRGKVPLKVKMATNVTSDIPSNQNDVFVELDNTYFVWVNSYGAVSAILPNGEKLGLYPSEFDVIEWHTSEANNG